MKKSFHSVKTPIAKLGIGAVMSIIALNCVKIPTAPTVYPQSDIQASIPIIDRTRTLGDMYSKPASNVKYDSSQGTYVYQSTTASKPASIDTIKATPHDQSSTVALGAITLPGLPSTNQAFTASSLGISPLPFTYPGAPFPTPPPFDVHLGGVALPSNPQFDWLAVDTGSVTLTVTNTLPLQLTFPKGLLLKNTIVANDTTAFFNIGTVDSAGTAGSTVVKTVHLSKKLLYSALAMDSVVFSTVSRNSSFTITSTSGVTFTFSSGSFVVDSASAVIPNQVIVPTTDSLFTVDDSIVVKQADFRSGTFNAVIQNHSNVTVAMYLRFNDLINTQTSASFVINQNLNPNSTNSFPVNLAQYKISTTPSALGTKLSFRLGINSIQSASKVSITSHDFISSGIQVVSPFVIKSVTGEIKPTTFAINTGAGGVNLGDANTKLTVDSVNFSQQNVTLNLGIYSGFVMDYNLTVQGISHKANKTITFTVPPPVGGTQTRIVPASQGGGITQIVLNNATGFNSFLNSFFPNLPDTFIVSGTITLNPKDVFGTAQGFATIYDTSKVYSSVGVNFPMNMGILNAQYTDVIPIKGKFDSTFVSNVKSGSLYFSLDNGLPISFGFLAKFQGYDTTLKARRTFLSIPVSGSPQTINGAPIDANGEATGTSPTNFSIGLVTSQILELVGCDSVAMVFQLSTSSAPKAVVFNADDIIHVRASANMVYTLKEKNK